MKKPKFELRFYKNYIFMWLPFFEKRKLMWKDKFATPRCECDPYFNLGWLWWGVRGTWGDDEYWEQWLWVYEYHDGDITKAKKEWQWFDGDTKLSTWDDSYVK